MAGWNRARVTEGVTDALHAAQTGATGTTHALAGLPDRTLIGVAAGSLGVGAGFYLARAPRLAIAAGILPALLTLAAVALRPVRAPDASAATARADEART